MKKLVLKVGFTYDEDTMHGDDKEAIDWFFNGILKDELILHSNEIGDEIGIVKVIEVIDDTQELEAA